MQYRFDEVLVDTDVFVLAPDGRPQVLEPKAFDLLCYFLARPNRVLSKRELLDAMWKDVAVTENVLARAVVLVRKALNDDARLAKYVRTVPTRGYEFVVRGLRVSDSYTSGAETRDTPLGQRTQI